MFHAPGHVTKPGAARAVEAPGAAPPGRAGSARERAARVQATVGNQAALRMRGVGGGIQAKLAVSTPGDAYEREADAVADRVLRGGDAAIAPRGATVPVQRMCAACDEEGRVQRREAPGATAPAPSLHAAGLRAATRAGVPLSAEVRGRFEPRFGHDFGSVRVHTDAAAAASADAIGALAYTHGRDIVFASGGYAPGTLSGDRLLAHELAHVVQQSGGQPQVVARQVAGSRCTDAHGACGAGDQCASPDPGTTSAPSTWTLEVKLDLEAASLDDACRTIGQSEGADMPLGHAYVHFIEPSGVHYTYGFYPAHDLPNPRRRNVPGCVVHPDTTHAACVDLTLRWQLTEQAFRAALAYAQGVCRTPGQYGEQYTCTSFVAAVAQSAGHALPSSRSSCVIRLPLSRSPYNEHLDNIDNPYTLAEALTRPCDLEHAGCLRWASGLLEMQPPSASTMAERHQQCERAYPECLAGRGITRGP